MITRPPEFDAYVAPAKDTAQLWRTLFGTVLTIATLLAVALSLELTGIWAGLFPTDGSDVDLNSRAALTVELLGFGGAIIGLWGVLCFVHNRDFSSLIGPKGPAKRHFIIAAGVVFVVNGTWSLVSAALFGGFIANNPLGTVLLFLSVGAILLLIQTGAEEFLFRGYLMQQLAAGFKSPVIWFILPSVIFGVIHYDPASMGAMVWPIIGALTLSGLVWADLVRVTGNIGAAWGWHFMNNFLLLNFATMQGSMTEFAWKVTAFGPDELTIWHVVPEYVLTLLIWAILRRVLRT